MPADRFIHPKLGHSAKVSGLNDLEYRVWTMYQLTSDDYGVMRMSAVTLQAACDSLAQRPAKVIDAALRRIVEVDLLKMFEHQGRRYIYQETWQNFQRVKHPRETMQPAPPSRQLAACTPATQKLFANHPTLRTPEQGDVSGNTSPVAQQDVGKISETDQKEKSGFRSLARAGTRETANGYRRMATGQRLPANGESPPIADVPADVWFEDLKAKYPNGRVTRDVKTQQAFCNQLFTFPDGPQAAWALLLENLAVNTRSHEWRVKRMVPWLYRYLDEGLWQNVLPADAPASESLAPKTNRTLAAAANILKEHA